MKVTIHCKNLKLSPAIESYTREKIGKIDKYFKNIVNTGAVVMHVELIMDKSGREGNKFVCEVTGFAPKKQFRVTQAGPQLYLAIDLAQEKLEEQVRKYKERFNSRTEDKTKEIMAQDQIEITRDLVFETGKPELGRSFNKIANLPCQVRRKRGPELAGMRKKAGKKKK